MPMGLWIVETSKGEAVQVEASSESEAMKKVEALGVNPTKASLAGVRESPVHDAFKKIDTGVQSEGGWLLWAFAIVMLVSGLYSCSNM